MKDMRWNDTFPYIEARSNKWTIVRYVKVSVDQLKWFMTHV